MPLKIESKLRKFFRSYASLKRLNHCIRVAETALEIGEKIGLDREKIILAAVLHDIARDLDKGETKTWAAKYYDINSIEQRQLVLLHGKAGAAIARENYGVTDEEVLEAVQYHTTGKPGMSDLAKVVLIADTIEPKRKHISPAYRRWIVGMPINEALKEIIQDQVQYLKDRNKPVADVTAALFVELTHGVNILET